MKDLKIKEALKNWLTPEDMQQLDELVKYLEELGDRAKNIKNVDEAYDFARDLGMNCTREEFKQGAESLQYIHEQIKSEEEKAKKQAEEAYMDAVAVYMMAEKRLKAASEEYSRYSQEMKAEFNANRQLAPEYAENAAKKLEEDAKKFYADVKKNFESSDIKQYLSFSKNIEALGKRLSKAKKTKEAYEIARELGLDCSWEDFKKTAKALGIYKD